MAGVGRFTLRTKEYPVLARASPNFSMRLLSALNESIYVPTTTGTKRSAFNQCCARAASAAWSSLARANFRWQVAISVRAAVVQRRSELSLRARDLVRKVLTIKILATVTR